MEILKDFGIEPILLLAQIVNFAILLYLLKRFLYKPILRVLEERKKRIETSLRQAEEIEKKFATANAKQEEILNAAREESAKIIEEAKEEAKTLAEKIQEEAKEGVESTMKRTQSLLALEKEKMVSEAKKEFADLVASATEKVLESTLTGPEKDRIVKKAIEKLEQ